MLVKQLEDRIIELEDEVKTLTQKQKFLYGVLSTLFTDVDNLEKVLIEIRKVLDEDR